jgi:hypothetical protein
VAAASHPDRVLLEFLANTATAEMSAGIARPWKPIPAAGITPPIPEAVNTDTKNHGSRLARTARVAEAFRRVVFSATPCSTAGTDRRRAH